MALVIFTDIAQISGSVAGSTYQRGKAGIVKRSKPIPTNPNTGRQQETRAILGTLSAAWSSVLTQAQRDAWDTYAEGNPIPGKLDRPVYLTGHQWYLRANAPLSDAEMSLIALPPVGSAPPSIVGLDVTIASAGTVTVAFTTALETGMVMVCWATKPKRVGSSPNFDQAQLVGYSDVDAVTPIAFTSPWAIQITNEMFVYCAQMSAEGLKSAYEVDNHVAIA